MTLSFKEFLAEASSAAEIQYQDLAGTWKTITRSINQPIYILKNMKDAKKMFKDSRIRAIDSRSGTLLDMLP